MSETKKYFVFISYSSKDNEDDNKWAEWLRHELEHWHLPTTYNGVKPQRDNLREVFRDRDGFSAGLEWDKQVKPILENSQNLIVLCSPNAKKSEAVNEEVKFFVDTGKEEHIFPFIIEGNGPDDCFPPALKRNKVGGDVNKDGGREDAFLKVVAGMLGVEFHDLRNKYQLEKIEQEQIEREKKENLQRLQSRYVAEKAEKLITEGDYYLARRLALEILPQNIKKKDRPYVAEAEAFLRKACEKENAVLISHTGTVRKAVFNSNESKIISNSYDGQLFVWNAKSGALIGKKDSIDLFAVHPTLPIIATASFDTIIIRNAKSLKCICKPFVHPRFSAENTIVWSVAFSKYGDYVVSGTSNGYVCVWDIRGTLLLSFPHENGEDLAVHDINADVENTIITTTHDSTKVWRLDGEKIIFCKYLHKHENEKYQKCHVKISNDGQFVVYSSDNIIYISDTHEFRIINTLTLPTHNKGVLSLDISVDDRCVVVGCGEELYVYKCYSEYDARHINIGSSKVKWRNISFIKYDVIIQEVKFNKNGDSVLVSLDNGELRLLKFGNTNTLHALSIAADSIDFSPNGKLFAVITDDGWNPSVFRTSNYLEVPNIELMDSETINLFVENKIGVEQNKIFFRGDSSLLVMRKIGSEELHETNIVNNTAIQKSFDFSNYTNHRCIFKTVSRNGRRAVFVFKDGTMLLVDVRKEKVIGIMEYPSITTVLRASVAFSYDSRYIVSSVENQKNKVWNAEDGTFITELNMTDNYSGGDICFNKSGSMIMLSSKTWAGTIYLWDWDKNTKMAYQKDPLKLPLLGVNEKNLSVAFSSDDALVVSASNEKIRIWDVQSGIILKEFSHVGDKKFVRFSPDGKQIITSDGKRLFVWEYPTLQELINMTRKRFGSRKLTTEERKQYYLE